jgi:coenzyme F420 biosynthesis associated uncharacterized protein
MVDWEVAVATARAVMAPGPAITREEAREVAEQLRGLVEPAERAVAGYTGMTVSEVRVPVAVVDRTGWVRANVEGFRVALEPLFAKLTEQGRRGPGSPLRPGGRGWGPGRVGSTVAGVQAGLLMAYLASRVLGQFELFLPPGEASAGRLTLVAPNIVETERRLGVDPADFRFWVTIHEVTHRTQFTAVPWLREWFTGQVRTYLDLVDLDPATLVERLRAVTKGGSLIEAVQSPEQRVVLDRLQALMSLLEGHGDHVMDHVGPAVVPTAAEIRRRFDERRRGGGAVDRFVRRLLGLDLKLRQYEEGARFVSAVVEAEGMDRFNAVWTSPETLPSRAEIRDPAAWVRRVLDRPAVADGA